MTNGIQLFNSEEFGEIRATEINGEPWFVGKDVALALGYIETEKAIRTHVHEDDKGVSQMDTPGGIQKMTVINESGLYALIFGSKLESAQRFKRWVTNEVLPSIRKHGAYATPATVEDMLKNPDAFIKILQEIKAERAEREKLEAESARNAPKVLFADSVATSNTDILIGDLAKLLRQNGVGIGQRRLFQWMRDKGYLMKQQGLSWNMPTQRAMEMELFRVKETTINKPDGSVQISKTTKVTGKGQIFFVNKFLESAAASA